MSIGGNTMGNLELEMIKFSVGSYYDYQHVRCLTQNRFRNLLRRKLLELGDEPEEKKEDEEKSYGKEWSDKEIKELINTAKEQGKLTAKDEEMLNTLNALGDDSKKFEKAYLNKINGYVENEQLYTEYLSKISGVGGVIAAGLLGYCGYCEKFDTVSKLWSYAGMGIYNGDIQKLRAGEKANWNPKLKVLCWKLGDSFVKCGKGYRKLYDQFKATYLAREDIIEAHKKMAAEKRKKDKSYKGDMGYKAHIHAMAKRKVVKLFLSHLWVTARTMKGLPVREPYAMEKLGHTTLIAPFTDENAVLSAKPKMSKVVVKSKVKKVAKKK